MNGIRFLLLGRETDGCGIRGRGLVTMLSSFSIGVGEAGCVEVVLRVALGCDGCGDAFAGLEGGGGAFGECATC